MKSTLLKAIFTLDYVFLKVNQRVISNGALIHTKPYESPIRLVQIAITSSDEQKMILQQVREWLKNNYRYYRSETT